MTNNFGSYIIPHNYIMAERKLDLLGHNVPPGYYSDLEKEGLLQVVKYTGDGRPLKIRFGNTVTSNQLAALLGLPKGTEVQREVGEVGLGEEIVSVIKDGLRSGRLYDLSLMREPYIALSLKPAPLSFREVVQKRKG